MRSLYLSLVIIILCNLGGAAQIVTSIQTIEATDGYIYKGWLIDNIDGVIRFENIEGDTLEFFEDEIIQYINPDDYFLYKNDKYHKKRGAFTMIDLGLGGLDDAFTLQFTYTYGKRVSPRLLLGAGTGFNFSGELNLLASQEFFGEFFLYTKYYLNDKRLRPFIDYKVGTIVGIDKSIRNDLSPGLLLQGGLGLEFAQQTETRFCFKINYLYMFAIAKVISQVRVFDDLSLKRSMIGITFTF